jgi:hypothetical protein
MKNCEVALSGALVRAIERVQRRFDRPLPSSSTIGGLVGLGVFKAVLLTLKGVAKPPPCITKFGACR